VVPRQCDGAEQTAASTRPRHAERHKPLRPASGRDPSTFPSTAPSLLHRRTVRRAPTCPEGASLEIRLATLVSQAGLEVWFYGPLRELRAVVTVADV